MLVRNTGKRVPAAASGDQAALPPRAVATEPGATASPATPKGRSPAQLRANGAALLSSPARAADGDQRHGGALDKLAKDAAPGGAMASGGADSGGVAAGGAAARGLPRAGSARGERSDEALHRTGGSATWQAPSLGRIPSQADSASGLPRESESFQNLHHSTHGRSGASQAVNTASTIDSMLAAGAQPTAQLAGAPQGSMKELDGAEELAHAQAIASLGLPHVGDGAPRRHAEVRVFDINTDGPPRGIPQDWEEGLLEGRKRPPHLARPATAAAAPAAAAQPAVAPSARTSAAAAVAEGRSGAGEGADREAGSTKASVRLQAAQHAAEQSVEQAKKRAARAKLVSRKPLAV